MSQRGVNRFYQREVSRALRGARDAGENVERVEVDPASGRITVIIGKAEAADEAAGAKAWNDATEAIVKSKKKVPKSAPTRR